MEVKVVINRCYGGFGLSEEAATWMVAQSPELAPLCEYEIPRDHPTLVRCVEELGSERASGQCARLEVVSFYIGFEIKDYDGGGRVLVNGMEV